MANPVRGEVAFEVEGERYVLVFDFNCICSVEDIFDMSISEVGKKMSRGMRATDLRTLVTAGLKQHHPTLTETEVGGLIGKLGADVAGEKLALAMQAAFPDAEAAEGTATPRPNRQQRRILKAS